VSVLLLTDQPQLADSISIVRLSLHVAAAAVWVGGQFVLAGLVPTIRGFGDDAPRAVARAFGRLSWPAFWLLIITGLWNYAAIDPSSATSSWKVVFAFKMVCVVISGVGAFLHTKATTARARGMWAGIGALGSIAALVLGVAIAG
jgi:putative copper export protein